MRFDGQKLADCLEKKRMAVGVLHQEMIRRGSNVTRSTLYNWVNGQVAFPNQTDMGHLCKVLGVPSLAFFAEAEAGVVSKA